MIWKSLLDEQNQNLKSSTMNGRTCNMNHRATGTPQGPGMISGQQIPPIRVHTGTPCPSSNSATPSPAHGNLYLKMPLGGGVAPQSSECTIHLPALSPRRQVITNGKPMFQVPQPPNLQPSSSSKPKQQEFCSPFPVNGVKGQQSLWCDVTMRFTAQCTKVLSQIWCLFCRCVMRVGHIYCHDSCIMCRHFVQKTLTKGTVHCKSVTGVCNHNKKFYCTFHLLFSI